MAACGRVVERALDKVKALQAEAVHPAKMQRYLSRWALWWSSATGKHSQALMNQWVNYTEDIQADQSWLGSGLLLGSTFDKLNRYVNKLSCLNPVVACGQFIAD